MQNLLYFQSLLPIATLLNRMTVIGDTQTQTYIAGVINGNGAGLTNLNGGSFAGNSLNLGGTNRVAPLTVPPNVPFTAIGGVGRGTGPVAVAMAGNYAYVVNYDGSMLQIFDVSTPSAPISNSFVSTLGGRFRSRWPGVMPMLRTTVAAQCRFLMSVIPRRRSASVRPQRGAGADQLP